jgi:hypothetical protein
VIQSENPLPVANARDCREKRVRNKALQMPCPSKLATTSWLFGTFGEPGDTRGGARYTLMYEDLPKCSSHSAFSLDVPSAA